MPFSVKPNFWPLTENVPLVELVISGGLPAPDLIAAVAMALPISNGPTTSPWTVPLASAIAEPSSAIRVTASAVSCWFGAGISGGAPCDPCASMASGPHLAFTLPKPNCPVSSPLSRQVM